MAQPFGCPPSHVVLLKLHDIAPDGNVTTLDDEGTAATNTVRCSTTGPSSRTNHRFGIRTPLGTSRGRCSPTPASGSRTSPCSWWPWGATVSAQALSGITIAQFLPIFPLGIPAGRLVFVVTWDPDLWLLYGMVGVLGSVQAFERVAAQTIIFELVGPHGLSRAASISTISLAAARPVGPALAGLAFQGLGPSACILINAAAYLLVFASRLRIRPAELHRRSSLDR